MGQYFTNDPNVISKQRIISYHIFDKQFDFISDNGVFSKGKIDQGSIALLKTIIPLNEISGNILDLGSGYGTIGLTLASFFDDAKFTLVDINTRACALARLNLTRMQLKNVEVIESDCFENIKNNIFDVIVNNPPIRAGKKIIYKMFQESYEHLAQNGKLFVVIRKDQGAKTALEFIKSVFGNCKLIAREKGYHILKAIK